MMRIWLWLVPDLAQIHYMMRDSALAKARRAVLTTGELLSLAVWLVLVSLLTRSILKGATDENRLAFTVVTNLLFTLPALLIVFIPIHIRRIRRDIRKQLK